VQPKHVAAVAFFALKIRVWTDCVLSFLDLQPQGGHVTSYCTFMYLHTAN